MGVEGEATPAGGEGGIVLTMTRYRTLIALACVGLLALLVWYLWLVAPKSAPWEKSGTLIIATRTIPGGGEDGEALGLTVDDVWLVRDGGEEVRATVLSRHVLLDEDDTRMRVMVDTRLAEGTYAGIRLTLRNPERRNAWQADTPPEPIALAGEVITAPVPFRIEHDTVTALLIGFEGRQALHTRGEDTVYLPVLHTEAHLGATVAEETDGTVEIRDGTVLTSMTFGMDWDGTVYFNYRPNPDGTLRYAPGAP